MSLLTKSSDNRAISKHGSDSIFRLVAKNAWEFFDNDSVADSESNGLQFSEIDLTNTTFALPIVLSWTITSIYLGLGFCCCCCCCCFYFFAAPQPFPVY